MVWAALTPPWHVPLMIPVYPLRIEKCTKGPFQILHCANEFYVMVGTISKSSALIRYGFLQKYYNNASYVFNNNYDTSFFVQT